VNIGGGLFRKMTLGQ
jgi:Ca2+-binding EF-hand superfamily protein